MGIDKKNLIAIDPVIMLVWSQEGKIYSKTLRASTYDNYIETYLKNATDWVLFKGSNIEQVKVKVSAYYLEPIK